MIYNFNLGIGWASSGVEYAQAYRANIFRKIGVEARFIFTDMFPTENIEHMTANIGFTDNQVIWLYTFFTDTKIAPVSYTLKDLEKTFGDRNYNFSRKGKIARYIFGEGNGNFCTAFMCDEESDRVHRVEYVSGGCLIKKDYYTYCKVYTEYYAPLDGSAYLYQRRYFNEDGQVAYEEIIDGDNVMFKFPDKVLYSKEELVAYMVQELNPQKDDIVIVDRTTDIGQPIFQNAGEAKLGIVIHADHFSEGSTTEDNILWNNFYEYSFGLYGRMDFYVSSTDAQKELLLHQYDKYIGAKPNVVTIPVGSIDELKYPATERKKHSLITASRLASEKHVDWLVQAVVKARKVVDDITLDIYGRGVEADKISALIEKLHAQDYIRMCGHKDLTEVYQNYDAYLSGSTSEGFGLSLLEAIGSGLPIVGFDVRYGNQTFIDDGLNGYKIPVDDDMDASQRIDKLAECVIKLFTQDDPELYHSHSYEVASRFLTVEVEEKWKELIASMA